MSELIDRYLSAANRENTKRSYESAIRHFEEEWGGLLPATPDSISRYLAAYAEKLSMNTLRQRLAALSHWHSVHGFPDPTKTTLIRQLIKGIKTIHPCVEKRAKPLQIEQLEHLDRWLELSLDEAIRLGNRAATLRHARDRAFLLLGFWRGFRGDELVHLCVEYVEVSPGKSLRCFLPRTKGDRKLQGATYQTPALSRLCPVAAYLDWLKHAQIKHGPVFRKIDRWGNLCEEGLHSNSLIPIMRSIFRAAGLTAPDNYSTHSLRRGFAGWAASSGWDIHSLMQYVGWKDVKSAVRYIEENNTQVRNRIEKELNKFSLVDKDIGESETWPTRAK